MQFDKEHIDTDLLKILNGEASDEEMLVFSEWLKEKEHLLYFSRIRKLWNLTSGSRVNEPQLEKEVAAFRLRMRHIRARERSRRYLRFVWRGVAAIFLIGGLTLGLRYFQVKKNEPVILATKSTPQTEIILSTSDGKQVKLNAEEEQLVNIGADNYARARKGMIVYPEQVKVAEKEQYNTLSIPRGGEFEVILSDGTIVSLNSKTELKYPVRFDQNERVVYVSGEAFFQVKKDISRPFYVKMDNGVTVCVYGTSFNVNTHHEKYIQTVLVEGSIGIQGNGPEYRLQPSQLAEFSRNGELMRLETVDIYPYVAWKDGMFVFEDQSLEEIMHTLSLWYDVDVFYTSEAIKEFHFTGNMERYGQIDRILKAIAKMVNVQFSVEGKTVVVSEKKRDNRK